MKRLETLSVVIGGTVALLTRLLLIPGPAVAQCCGDCNGDGGVTIDELVRAVNRALDGCQDDGVCDASVATCNATLSSCNTSLTGCQRDLSTCQCGQRFPATGQTACWDYQTGSSPVRIACSGTGQDGEIQAGGALAYADNGDGTISDLNTHLIWEKKSWDGSIHDWSNQLSWADAFSVFIGRLNTPPCFAGHCDWRLPNLKELQSIVDYQNTFPAVSTTFNTNCAAGCSAMTCSCTQSSLHSYYWSSTSYAGTASNAWVVGFDFGPVLIGFKTATYYVRAVRGGL
jgi:hypothetical protein